MKNTEEILIIGCGAIAHEINEIIKLNNWENVQLQCLNAELHNRPEKLPKKIKFVIDSNSDKYSKIFLAYADCGTGGLIDSMLKDYKIERLKGAHCYEFFAGNDLFSKLSEEEPGTFYLTDFLTKNFERLVVRGLKLDQHPELIESFFGNYKRVIYLVQSSNSELTELAMGIADYLGLEFEERLTGFGDLERSLGQKIFATS